MNIRLETKQDINQIEAITYRAFENHPHHAPGAKPTEHEIVNKLREEQALTLSLVCEDETGIIGHIAFSPVLINGEPLSWYWLGPVSVVPERQSEGIGGKLIREGIALLKERSAEGIVLLGEPQYYGRFAFEPRAELVCEGVPEEFFLALPLQATTPKGVVTYHSAFFETYE